MGTLKFWVSLSLNPLRKYSCIFPSKFNIKRNKEVENWFPVNGCGLVLPMVRIGQILYFIGTPFMFVSHLNCSDGKRDIPVRISVTLFFRHAAICCLTSFPDKNRAADEIRSLYSMSHTRECRSLERHYKFLLFSWLHRCMPSAARTFLLENFINNYYESKRKHCTRRTSSTTAVAASVVICE